MSGATALTWKAKLATGTYGTTSPVTEGAPSAVDGTDGQPIQDLAAVTVTVSCPASQTFSGAGTFDCYILTPGVNRWSRLPSADFGSPLAGVRDHTYEPLEGLGVFLGMFIKWVPTGVTFSGGSTGITVTQQGTPFSSSNKKAYQ